MVIKKKAMPAKPVRAAKPAPVPAVAPEETPDWRIAEISDEAPPLSADVLAAPPDGSNQVVSTTHSDSGVDVLFADGTMIHLSAEDYQAEIAD